MFFENKAVVTNATHMFTTARGGEGTETTDRNRNPEAIAIVTKDALASWVEPAAGKPLEFRGKGQSQPITLVPLNSIVHEQYAVYWKVQNKG